MTTLGKDLGCSIARSLEPLGEKWSLLIVRQAFRGDTRFSQFQSSLGVSRDILADRLTTLTAFGIFDRRPYKADGERERDEYVLTEAGQALGPVLAALTEWGDRFRPFETGPTAEFTEIATGQRVHQAFVTEDGRIVGQSEVRSILKVA